MNPNIFTYDYPIIDKIFQQEKIKKQEIARNMIKQ
jgi:hypothetical protein